MADGPQARRWAEGLAALQPVPMTFPVAFSTLSPAFRSVNSFEVSRASAVIKKREEFVQRKATGISINSEAFSRITGALLLPVKA